MHCRILPYFFNQKNINQEGLKKKQTDLLKRRKVMDLKSKSEFSIFVIGLATILGSLIFQGCQEDDITTDNGLPYLSVDSKIDLPNLSEQDMYTLQQALGRIEIYRNGGFYKIKQTSGAQINISEELFDFLKNSVAHTNEIFKRDALKLPVPRLKSGQETDLPQDEKRTDCLARAIAGNSWKPHAFDYFLCMRSILKIQYYEKFQTDISNYTFSFIRKSFSAK
jgi:hypothetical protein